MSSGLVFELAMALRSRVLLAAPWLILREAGGVASDGSGQPLDHHRLLGSGHEFQMSSICASNAPLHAQLVREVDRGIERLLAQLG